MNDLKDNIKKELEILEKMISLNKDKEKIETQRKKLDKLLEEYLKDLWLWNVLSDYKVLFFVDKRCSFYMILTNNGIKIAIYTKIVRLYEL